MWLLSSSARMNSDVFGAEVIVLLESGSGVPGFDVACYLPPVGNVLALAGSWISTQVRIRLSLFSSSQHIRYGVP
jgi:hypothetical protein